MRRQSGNSWGAENMGKRSVIVLLTAVCMALSSCQSSVPQTESLPHTGVSFSNEDKLTVDIRERLKKRQYNIVIEYNSKTDDLTDTSELINRLMDKAVSETGQPDEGDYLAFQLGGYDAKTSCESAEEGYLHTISIFPHCYTDVRQEEKVDERVREISRSFGFDEDTPDIEKLRRIYDYIYDNVEYDIIHKNNAGYHLKSTAYGALINGHATCQGYAVTLYRLLRENGVDCRVITGKAYDEDLGEEYHAWNIAGIDGKYYFIDITWDKRLETRADKLLCRESFYSHTPDEKYTKQDFCTEYPVADEDMRF